MPLCYGDWTVSTQRNTVVDENGKYKDAMVTSLEVEDISVLPNAVYKLVEWGHDLSATVQAIKDATEKQQKAKQAESLKEKRKQAARARIAKDPAIQRFIIAYNKKDSDEIKTGQGTRLGDGSLNIEMAVEFPIGGFARDEDGLRSIADRYGYEYHLEYMD